MLCGEYISPGDRIYPVAGRLDRDSPYWICEPCKVDDPDRPVNREFLTRKIRHRLTSPLVNRSSACYTPRVRELRVLADLAAEREVHTSADTDLRAKIALWSLTNKPRGLGRREAETLLRWLEEADGYVGA